MIDDDVNALSKYKRCVFYNDLSHMNPRYLSASSLSSICVEDEAEYHKKNIYLLLLQFDNVLLCTDNILSFSNSKQANIIKNIVSSPWFNRLVSGGAIVLCGMGASRSRDLIQNQIDYSTIYRPDLKDSKYITHCKAIANNCTIIPREYEDGETDFIDVITPYLMEFSDICRGDEFKEAIDAVIDVNSKVGYIGTMDIYPKIKSLFPHSLQHEDAFYGIFYKSFQEYTNKIYTDTYTVNTARAKLVSGVSPKRIGGEVSSIVNSLLSPEFFEIYLEKRLGKDLASRFTGIDPEQLLMIRNGDWKVFTTEYHKCISAISKDRYINSVALTSDFLHDKENISRIIEMSMSNMLDGTYDIENYVATLSGVISYSFGSVPLSPIFKIFNKAKNNFINLSRDIMIGRGSETKMFLRKLACALNGKHLILSI